VQGNRSIATTYLPGLGPEAAAAHGALRRHFAGGGVVSAIRNKVSFHYSDKKNLTEASFQQLGQDDSCNSICSRPSAGRFITRQN
jgi:hypothetical protein